VVSFDEEPIVAYFDNPVCNNPAENDGEWVLNKNSISIIPCVLMM